MNSKALVPACFGIAFMTPHALAVDLIPFGADWDYMHPTDGVDPAIADPDFDTTWMLGATDFATNYNGPAFGGGAGPNVDSGTGAAPIGYGAITYIDNTLGGLATTLTEPAEGARGTAYFRRAFTVASDVDDLALDIIADDGAVLYLDGALLLAVNIDAPDTYAATTNGTASENDLLSFTAALGSVSAGTHVLAMSVHQSAPDSSDLGFDLRLSDEGTSTAVLGTTDFGGVVADLFLAGSANGWLRDSDTGEHMLNNADGGTIASEIVDLSTETGVLFFAEADFDESSGGTNFEDLDTFSARLELTGPGGDSTIVLAPFGHDANQDGTLAGEEFLPGIDASLGNNLRHVLVAEIPDEATSAQLVIEAINDSDSETFRVRNVTFTDVKTSLVLGTVDFGAPADLGLLHGPNAWVEDAPKVFSLNDADATGGGRVLLSREVDLSASPPASVRVDLRVEETSASSNFEAADFFAAWVEVLDDVGTGSVVQLVNIGNDLDDNRVLSADEFAPGVDVAEEVMRDFTLAANLPSNAVKAQIVIAAENDSGSETFRISNITVGPALPDPADFAILSIVPGAGGGFDITWESEAGISYDIQFSQSLGPGTFVTVDTVAGQAGTTTQNHDPGPGAEGYYRIAR